MAIRTSKNVIWNAERTRSILVALGAATVTYTGWDDALVRLFQGALTPTPTTVVTDLEAVECDFTGYAAAVVTPWVSVITRQNEWALFQSVNYSIDGFPPYDSNTATGYWVEDSAGGLIISERFAAPVTLTTIGDFLDLNVFIPLASIITLPDQS